MDEQGRKLFESRAGGHDTRRKSEVRPPKQLEKQHPPGLQDYRDETPGTPVSGVFVFRLAGDHVFLTALRRRAALRLGRPAYERQHREGCYLAYQCVRTCVRGSRSGEASAFESEE